MKRGKRGEQTDKIRCNKTYSASKERPRLIRMVSRGSVNGVRGRES